MRRYNIWYAMPWLIVLVAVGCFLWRYSGSPWIMGSLRVAQGQRPHAADMSATQISNLLPPRVTFDRYIRPILAENCYTCHGPDEHYRKSGFRLDTEASLYALLPGKLHKGWHAFVPGHPEKSLAYLRMTSKDPSLKMPPPGSHLTVDPLDAALVKKWIQQGAVWQPHWAYVPLVVPKVPNVGPSKWVRNDIDRFVLAKLRAHGLTPSRQASRGTLIRRVTMDLTGLPPTLQQVQNFENDRKPGAYERVVDRLLASPAYGEQMAVSWLDDARYADSYGFLNDPSHSMWLWRNWVINAFNQNMPFDKFTIKQLAGDLLPHPTTNDLIATGFNRNNMINTEGGIIHEEFRVQGVIDRVDTTGETWLGLTIACGQCHHHKYENISHRDFYSFYAFFNSVNEKGVMADMPGADSGIDCPPILRVPDAKQKQQLDALKSKIAALQKDVAEIRKQSPAFADAWFKAGAKLFTPVGRVANLPLNGTVMGAGAKGAVVEGKYVGKGKPVFTPAPIGKAFLADGKGAGLAYSGDLGKFSLHSKFSVSFWVKRQGNGSILGRMQAGPTLRGWDCYLAQGRLMFHLIHVWPSNAISVQTKAQIAKNKWTHVTVTYNGSGKARGVKIFFNQQRQPLDVLNNNLTKSTIGKAKFFIGRRVDEAFFSGSVAHVELFDRALSLTDVRLALQTSAVKRILELPAAKRTVPQQEQLARYALELSPQYKKMRADLTTAKAALVALRNSLPVTQIMQELPTPRPTYTLQRGQYNMPGRRVYPATPHAFPPMLPGEPPNRLGLAEWIMQPDNPLTSRVLVNRLWAKFFGRGLCSTTDNVGVLGSYPSHVKLLDWLAAKMLAMRWNLKAFQKMIVLSATYRQCSAATPALIAADPKNRWLERGPRFRLTAEEIRDQALAASGLLNRAIGGPSVKPYEPLDLWAGNVYGNLAQYKIDYGPGLYRRSLYTFIKRSAPPPDMTAFDMPDRQTCTIQRSVTDTPLQALVTLNDVQYVESARMLAQKMMLNGGQTPGDRIAYGFRRLLAQAPRASQAAILLQGFSQALAHYEKHPKAAEKLIHMGYSKPDAAINPVELAAYTVTAGVMLNMDETLNLQ